MMTLDLFTIVKEQIEGQKADFLIHINPDYPIFQGHFPGLPITPGVIIVQIGKELFEYIHRHEFNIVKIKNVKFINVIIPHYAHYHSFHFTWEIVNPSLFVVKILVDDDQKIYSKISIEMEYAQ